MVVEPLGKKQKFLSEDVLMGDRIEESGDVDLQEVNNVKKNIISLEQYAHIASSITTNGQTGPGSIWLYAKRDSTSGDSQSLSSHTFDPSKPLVGYSLPPEKKEGSCPYGLIAHALDLIENLKASGSGSRKKTIVVLANLFRLIVVKFKSELINAIYCIINKVGPDYEGLELGVGDQIVMRAMAEAYGRKESDLKAMIDRGEVADLGEAALESRVKQSMLMQPAPLTVAKVFKDLRTMAESSGKNSQSARKEIIKRLLVSGKEKEAKFIVRTLQGKLRVGIQNASVLQSLANAVCLTFGTVSDVRAVKDFSKQKIEASMIAMEDAVRQAFCEMPNYELLVKALLQDDSGLPNGENLIKICHVTPMIPVKPMLAKPTRSVGEVLGRFTGIQFTAEYKYDGERAQIHILDKEVIEIFSRNSERMTEKYPDVVETLKEMLHIANKEGGCKIQISSAIIDAEVVAFSREDHKILPFQTLSTRARKNVKTEDIKVAVCLFPFDLIYLNGQSLVKEPLRTRRDTMRSVIPEMGEKLQFAVGKDLSTSEEVEAFLGEAMDHQCEGLMIKTLDENASYEPSKRSLNWLKLKKDYVEGIGDSVDVVPIGGYRGKGKRTGVYGAFLLAVFDASSGEFQTCCKIGTGLSDADLVQHYEFFKDHLIHQKRIDYDVHDSLYPDDWFDAVQVWEIQAADLSISPIHSSGNTLREDGKGIGLRFPRFLRIRDDKGPEDATSSEQILQMFEDQFKSAAASAQNGNEEEDDYDL